MIFWPRVQFSIWYFDPGVNFLSLVHLDQRSRWTIAITWHPASVVCKLFTFQASSPKPLGQLEPNLAGMFLGWSSTKFMFFYVDRKFKMIATAGHRLTLDPMGKCSNAFFSETTNMIKAKLYMNVHWMVLYKLYVFCCDMKFKMAATAGLSLTLDPMGKMFQNASSLKPLG